MKTRGTRRCFFFFSSRAVRCCFFVHSFSPIFYFIPAICLCPIESFDSMKFSHENYMAQRIDRGSCVLLGLNCMCKLRKMMTNGKWREGSQKNSLKEKFGVFFLSFQSKSNNYINDSSGSGGGTHKMNCIPMAIILRGMLILAVLYSSVCLFHFVPFHFIPGRARSFLFFVLSLIISLYMLLLLYGCFGSVVLAFCARERQRNGLHSTAQHNT